MRHLIIRFQFLSVIVVLFSAIAVLAQPNPGKLAAECRVDLMGSAGVEALIGGRIVLGSGWIDHQTWLSTPAEQGRSFFSGISIVHFAWTECALEFTPSKSGTVEIALSGPWEETPGSENPVIIRKR